jgi:hypothetical protein
VVVLRVVDAVVAEDAGHAVGVVFAPVDDAGNAGASFPDVDHAGRVGEEAAAAVAGVAVVATGAAAVNDAVANKAGSDVGAVAPVADVGDRAY